LKHLLNISNQQNGITIYLQKNIIIHLKLKDLLAEFQNQNISYIQQIFWQSTKIDQKNRIAQRNIINLPTQIISKNEKLLDV
jgi:hypothetical protein